MATVVTHFPTLAERAHRARVDADRPRRAWRDDAGFLRLLPGRPARVESRDLHSRSGDPDTDGPDAA